MALASLVFPHRLLRASLEDTREAFLFRFDCRVAKDVKHATFFLRLEWITCEPRREKIGVPMSDFRSIGKYVNRRRATLLAKPRCK